MSISDIFPIDKWDFKSQSVLADLPHKEYEQLMLYKSEKHYKKGEIIFREGAYADGIFLIISGKVKKFKLDSNAKEYIIYVANTGEIVGYHALLTDTRYSDSTATLEDSQLLFIPRAQFLSVLQQSEILNKRLLKTLSHEFTVLANSLSLFAQKSVRERLALQLIVMREKYKVNFKPGMSVEINMSRTDLANLVGTARENVVRILSEFKDKGIVETRGRTIVVHDVNRLIKIADYT